MTKRASFLRFTQEKLSLQPPQNAHGQQSSSPSAKKGQRMSPTGRVLRDMLNPHPIRYEGGCWPTAVPRKK